jgi:hypothetical protein
MAKPHFQIAVLSVDAEEKEELMIGAIDPFNPPVFQAQMQQCLSELAHGGKLIDEVKRKLVIEFEFDSDKDLSTQVEAMQIALRDECFKFRFMHPTVTHCEISPSRGFLEKAKVNCIFSDGSSKVVFDFFDDELSFRSEEFLGLTAEQCSELFTRRDTAYLKS